ncbi:MAG: tetraacyldisaccharide 4'-kinase [Planctomycetaceae bacterium]
MNPEFYHSLMSGEWRGLIPSCLRGLLTVGEIGYRGAVRLRNTSFDRGWRTIHRADVPVVSVGNVTAGGTGKTPCVAFLTEWFLKHHLRVAILSRGYRSLKTQDRVPAQNDEKLLLDRLCPGVPHLQLADRVCIAREAVRDHASQVLILDDGFQHRRLARQLDIVLIDCLNPWGYGRLLPRGLLREPLSSLRRAHLIFLTRADYCSVEQRQQIDQVLQATRGSSASVDIAFQPTMLIGRDLETGPLELFLGQEIMAVSGIGNPRGFEQSLERLGYQVAGQQRFPDHHHYSLADCEQISREATAKRTQAIVMTEKDIVKIPRSFSFPLPVWSVRLGTRILAGDDLLESHLQNVSMRISGAG